MSDIPSPTWIRSAVEITIALISGAALVVSVKIHPKMDKLKVEVDGKMKELLDAVKELAALKAVLAERAQVAQKECAKIASEAVGALQERESKKNE